MSRQDCLSLLIFVIVSEVCTCAGQGRKARSVDLLIHNITSASVFMLGDFSIGICAARSRVSSIKKVYALAY